MSLRYDQYYLDSEVKELLPKQRLDLANQGNISTYIKIYFVIYVELAISDMLVYIISIKQSEMSVYISLIESFPMIQKYRLF